MNGFRDYHVSASPQQATRKASTRQGIHKHPKAREEQEDGSQGIIRVCIENALAVSTTDSLEASLQMASPENFMPKSGSYDHLPQNKSVR